jgi:Undecaprenyl-phosphate glucose phosphotransferase
MLQLHTSPGFNAKSMLSDARTSASQRFTLGRLIPRDPKLGAIVLALCDMAVFLATMVIVATSSVAPQDLYLRPELLHFFVTSFMCFIVAHTLARSYRGESYFRISRVSRLEFAVVPGLITGGAVLFAAGIEWALSQGLALTQELAVGGTALETPASTNEYRTLELLFAGTAAATLCFERLLILGYLRSLQSTGFLATQIVLFGADSIGQRLMRVIRDEYPDTVQVRGVFDDRIDRVPAEIEGVPVERGMNRLIATVRDNPDIEKVLIALPMRAEQRILELLQTLRHLDVDVALVPEFVGMRVNRKLNRDPYPQLLDVGRRAQSSVGRLAKRGFDSVAALLLLAVLSPVFAAVALAIKVNSPGPVFFMQPRMGFNNRQFSVFKFRSMYSDCADLAAKQQTKRNDSRVTRVGAFLRRTSIDELPQLINVLRGDMSLVGPRPHALGMQVGDQLCDEIVREYAVRHRVKPGITGWAQVRGLRGAIEQPELLVARVQHDIYYIDNWSFFFDLRILIMTAVELVRTKNAF